MRVGNPYKKQGSTLTLTHIITLNDNPFSLLGFVKPKYQLLRTNLALGIVFDHVVLLWTYNKNQRLQLKIEISNLLNNLGRNTLPLENH